MMFPIFWRVCSFTLCFFAFFHKENFILEVFCLLSWATGCFFSMSKVMCLWESLKIQNMSGDWCFHFTEIGPFWDLVSKKFHNHSVIIHLWRLRRCIIAKISKIHFIIAISRVYNSCARIYAPIWMKFDT